MPKIFILKILLVFGLAGSVFGYDFSHCMKYYDIASTPLKNTYSISLKTPKKNVSLLFSLLPPQGVKVLKRDPFVGLYLIETKETKYAYHLLDIDGYARSKELAAIGSKTSAKGKILKSQSGFIHYAQFSTPIPINGVVSNICYQIYGIGVGGKYFIDKKYIDRFLRQNSPYYGDIGIRVSQENKSIIVVQVDPFFKENPFLPNDKIISIDNQAIVTPEQFEWNVSNLAYHKNVEVDVIRNGKHQKLKVIADKRYGGFLLPDTFLERFGIKLNQKLEITEIDKSTPLRLPQFQVGDRIVWINHEAIIKPNDDSEEKIENSLRSAFSQAGIKGTIEVLIDRDGLEFYIKL
ncbi:PDZ domain-containing protein [Helicobacter sp. 11S03491-1]|uniref:DUF7488 domain-containing protein n=1 Tax=Helicobacter sp. 11S03491-1 TaxID=1476196 RepID=UPI000BA4F48E|nr:PDZ domain-containing protein [Helicobacter sp. 11S03491-1]PAF42071.1 hypothetical protein BKH45_05305 [Helicobacter sp. 11S03491-1]